MAARGVLNHLTDRYCKIKKCQHYLFFLYTVVAYNLLAVGYSAIEKQIHMIKQPEPTNQPTPTHTPPLPVSDCTDALEGLDWL